MLNNSKVLKTISSKNKYKGKTGYYLYIELWTQGASRLKSKQTSSRSTYGPAPSGNISSTAGFMTVEFDWSFRGMNKESHNALWLRLDLHQSRTDSLATESRKSHELHRQASVVPDQNKPDERIAAWRFRTSLQFKCIIFWIHVLDIIWSNIFIPSFIKDSIVYSVKRALNMHKMNKGCISTFITCFLIIIPELYVIESPHIFENMHFNAATIIKHYHYRNKLLTGMDWDQVKNML